MRRLALALPVLALLGCDQAEMRDQPKYEAYEAAAGFPHGASAMLPPEGVVPRDARPSPVPPQPPTTLALLQRGQGRFDAMCSPCHGRVGDGDGMVVRRGFPPPPSLHLARLRTAPDAHIYRVIGEGYGVMYSYADRVPPEDRWAVAAYIRALQLSQHAVAAELPPDLRARLPADGAAR